MRKRYSNRIKIQLFWGEVNVVDRIFKQCFCPLCPPTMRKGTHFTGGGVVPRAGLNWCGISHPHRDSILGPIISYIIYYLYYMTEERMQGHVHV